MKTVGIILVIIGIIGILVFGIQAINDSETFSILGLDIAVTKANWTPLIISSVITVLGLVVVLADKKRS